MQCQWMTNLGQCRGDAMDSGKFCVKHTPNSSDMLIGQYLINKRTFGDAPLRHLEADEVQSLKADIALLRSAIEKRINMIESDAEFVSAMPSLKDSLLAVEKLATSCHAMETKLDVLISKPALLSLAQKIVHIIAEILKEVPGKDELVEQIGIEIAAAMEKQEN